MSEPCQRDRTGFQDGSEVSELGHVCHTRRLRSLGSLDSSSRAISAIAMSAGSASTYTSGHKPYGLDDNTLEFIGHALTLHRDDSYPDKSAMDTIKRMKVYAESLARFQSGSPHIYPLYGLGELP